ncbi:uncharacterized protein LOC9646989 isoform X3 [Selaginella moellendorffii]|uniref:uncharacterized protein LOC9646989 isoform X3 n=1 Tax=Selaginella moellendorffii TaxID=88036 RepID=UPI000D1C481C|nr:uncharacterized protein LOC9646989 isoform X3 [Selaginella moellendorffii]|eukprot:XP_024541896.1 uncharacterized protein LOC9646989 isoform X3 [Selaginella moellendorffii]
MAGSSDGASRWIEASSRLSSSRHSLGSARQAPQLAFFVLGKFLRLLSVYALFKFLSARNGTESIVVFTFVCSLVSGALFFIFQRPWHGRPLTTSQIYLTALNGGVLALALLLWGKSLQACGPVRTVLAEYTGAMLGAASTLVLGRGGHKWKKGGGLAAMLVAFYVLFRGWTIASLSPFSAGSSDSDEQGRVGLGPISMSIAAGTLFALRRIVARRVSIKATMKKRLHSITVAAATCFLFPFAMLQLSLGQETSPTTEAHGSPAWAYMSTIVFGMVAGFYVDNYAEERLHILATSSEHLLVTSVLLIVLELVIYQMDFSLVGFLICSSLLGFGIYESTSSEKLPSEIVSSTPPM